MAKTTKSKREALTVGRFIKEILVDQLRIPFVNVVNDSTFKMFTRSDRPDLLISEVPYDLKLQNDSEFIKNLLAYGEAKDSCVIDSSEWKDAIKQGKKKAKLLKVPFFFVTNCKETYFFNTHNGKELNLNGSPLREFQNMDILRIINRRLQKNATLFDISTSVDAKSAISEATFNKKLWDLARIYRGLNFSNISEKIDFTIGFISLKYFEEKLESENKKLKTKTYWSSFRTDIKNEHYERFLDGISGYIQRLEAETEFSEFKELMEVVNKLITRRDSGSNLEFDIKDTAEIYSIIDGMGKLHDSGFDLFGAVYEMFASNKEKSDFGEFFTRRHYAHIFSKLLLKSEKIFDKKKEFRILDPACGTGGFLTEAFKILQTNYRETKTLFSDAIHFIKNKCIYGYDVKQENVSRTKLNMFLVGDGHTNIEKKNTLKAELSFGEYDYIITNPPYGNGVEKADTSYISTKRTEIAFIAKIMRLLKPGGKACIITPDGFFENPSYEKFRVEVLEKCIISSIISLPKFAFAPYTKEKTYALFIEKKSELDTEFQKHDIWLYIIDNDGFANSDNRFPTKLKDKDNKYLHDELSFWVDNHGNEKISILEERWMKYDDESTNGIEWINDKGIVVKLRKGGFVKMDKINGKNYHNILPEYHLRKKESDYVALSSIGGNIFDSIAENVKNLNKQIKDIKKNNISTIISDKYSEFVQLNFMMAYISRNDSLSEEGIYNNERFLKKVPTIKVLSGSIENIVYGEISLNTPNIHYLNNKQGLHLVTRGKAGKLAYIPKGIYASNTNAFILFLKDDSKKELGIKSEKDEEYYLKFLRIYLEPIFRDISSKSDIGVFPLTKVFEDLEIPKFILSKEIKNIVNKYDKIKMVEDILYRQANKLDNVISKTVI